MPEIEMLLASMKDKRKTVKPNNTGERSRSPSPPGGGASAKTCIADNLTKSIFLHYLEIRSKIEFAKHQESVNRHEEMQRARSERECKTMTCRSHRW